MKLNQLGAINALFIPFVVVTLLFFGATAFGAVAFIGRQDYKNNVDQKIAAAVEVAKKETASAKDNEFKEQEKHPLKPYTTPATFGSVSTQVPKTWSIYSSESGKGTTPISAYFHPNYVPAIDGGVSLALRLEILENSYSEELQQFDSAARAGTVKVSPYAAQKVPSVVGARIDGEIGPKKKGSIVLLPLRDKTIKIWTEADQFQKDFNESVLPNLTFTP